MSLIDAVSDAGVAFVGTLIKGNSYINSLKKELRDASINYEKLKLEIEIDKNKLLLLQTQVFKDLANSKLFEDELKKAKRAQGCVSDNIKEQEEIIRKYETKITQLKTEYANFKNVKEKEIQGLKKKAAEEIGQYTAELDIAKKQLYQYQRRQLQQKLTFENEIQNLQNQLITQFTPNHKIDLMETIQNYESKIEKLKRSQQDQLEQNDNLQGKLKKLLRQTKSREKEYNDCYEVMQEYERKLSKMLQENKQSQSELIESQSQMMAYEEIIQKLRIQVTKQKNECKDQILAYSQLASQLEKEIIKNQQLEQQLKECKEQSKRIQAEINEKLANSEREYQKELKQIQQEFQLQTQKLNEQKLEQDRIQKQLKDVEIKETERSKKFAASYQNLMGKLLQYEKRLQNLEEQKNQLQNIEMPKISSILESVESECEVNKELNKKIIEFIVQKLKKLKSDHKNYQEMTEQYLENQNTKQGFSTPLQLLNLQSVILEQFTLLQQNRFEVIKRVKLTENSIDCLQSSLQLNFLPRQFAYLETQQTEIKRFSVQIFEHNQILNNNQKINELQLTVQAYIKNSKSVLKQYACKIDTYLNGIKHFLKNNKFISESEFDSFQTKYQGLNKAYQQLKIAMQANTEFEKKLNMEVSQ